MGDEVVGGLGEAIFKPNTCPSRPASVFPGPRTSSDRLRSTMAWMIGITSLSVSLDISSGGSLVLFSIAQATKSSWADRASTIESLSRLRDSVVSLPC